MAAGRPVVAPRLGQLMHALTHVNGHAHGARCGVRAGQGVVEKDHQAVPCEALQRALEAEDKLPHGGMILVQDLHHLFGLCCIRKGREAPQVAEDHGDLTPVALQQSLIPRGDEQFGQVRGKETLHAVHAFQRRELLGNPLLERAIPRRDLLEVARVLERQDRLRGEGLQELHAWRGELSWLRAIHHQTTKDLLVKEERHRQEGTIA